VIGLCFNRAEHQEPEGIHRKSAYKLCSVQVGDCFQVIPGCVRGDDWTTTRPAEMVITPDRRLLRWYEDQA
jgi:hypothetical protein